MTDNYFKRCSSYLTSLLKFEPHFIIDLFATN